jgi:hypothetical protein
MTAASQIPLQTRGRSHDLIEQLALAMVLARFGVGLGHRIGFILKLAERVASAHKEGKQAEGPDGDPERAAMNPSPKRLADARSSCTAHTASREAQVNAPRETGRRIAPTDTKSLTQWG